MLSALKHPYDSCAASHKSSMQRGMVRTSCATRVNDYHRELNQVNFTEYEWPRRFAWYGYTRIELLSAAEKTTVREFACVHDVVIPIDTVRRAPVSLIRSVCAALD